jgi:hypothetical protein
LKLRSAAAFAATDSPDQERTGRNEFAMSDRRDGTIFVSVRHFAEIGALATNPSLFQKL